MNLKFRVHGVSTVPVNVPAVVGGENMLASVPCLEVELVSVDDISGSLTVRFYGADMDAAKALYVQDSIVVASMAADTE